MDWTDFTAAKTGLTEDECGIVFLIGHPWPLDYAFVYSLLDDAPAAGFQKDKVEVLRSSLAHMQADGLDERVSKLQGLPVLHGRDEPIPKVDPNIEIEHHYLGIAETTGQTVDVVRRVNQAFLTDYVIDLLKGLESIGSQLPNSSRRSR